MPHLVLANVGTHDVQHIAPSDERSSRPQYVETAAEAQRLLADAVAWAGLDLPILRLLLSEVRKATRSAPHLLLFVTDQSSDPRATSVAKRKDTLQGGLLIEKLLGSDGPEHLRGLAARVILAPPVTSGPQDYDAMLTWFAAHLPDAIRKCDIRGHDLPELKLHVSVTAGTPAMSMALLLRAYDLASQGLGSVDAVWHVDQFANRAVRLKVGRIITERAYRQVLGNHLQRRDYDAAAVHLRGDAPRDIRDLLGLVMAPMQRCAFDAAFGALERVKRTAVPPELANWLRALNDGQSEYRKELMGVSPGIAALHSFLIEQLRLDMSLGDYSKALAVLYRLQESLVRLRFEQITKLTGDKDRLRTSRQREKWVQGAEDWLHSYKPMRSLPEPPCCTMEYQANLIRAIEPGAPLSCWLGRLVEELPDKKPNLRRLRNKSMLAHGYGAVTEQDLRDAGWESWQAIVDEARGAAEAVLGMPLPPAPYEQVHSAILNALFPASGPVTGP